VHIVTRRHLSEASVTFKDAANELGKWVAIVAAARWRNIEEVRAMFKDVDPVDGYVVFNIRHNRYRLITVIHYARDLPKETAGHIYIRSFLTHADYNDKSKWDPFAG
jgi:mRNA interferase HigB